MLAGRPDDRRATAREWISRIRKPMHLTPQEFSNWEHKAITLLGISGIGKTTLANKLPKTEWFHYSADYRIGTKYLEESQSIVLFKPSSKETFALHSNNSSAFLTDDIWSFT